MKSKKIAISAIAALMVLSGGAAFFSTFSAKKASAETNTASTATTLETDSSSTATSAAPTATSGQTMADKLATKLGVDANKVKSALDEIKQERQTEHQAKVSANLDQAVKDGVITSEQKQKILDKQAEVQKQREQERTDMENWAKDNGIDLSKLRGYLGRGLGHHLKK